MEYGESGFPNQFRKFPSRQTRLAVVLGSATDKIAGSVLIASQSLRRLGSRKNGGLGYGEHHDPQPRQ